MPVDYNQLKKDRAADWREELRKTLTAKERTKIERVKMPERPANERNKDFDEVPIGLSEDQARTEASRCLDCSNPTCISGCPVNINIPGFIKEIERGKFLESAKVLKQTNALPAVCGRVCPQETQCEEQCIYNRMKKRPVAIGMLERWASDYERSTGNISIPGIAEKNNIKVAIVGSGPAGLTVAGELAKWGYDVTIFEALHEYGGVLVYGIPEFRLPKEIVRTEIGILEKMGVKLVKNFIVGRSASFDDLREEGFKAFFIASGAGLPSFMRIPGENLINIYSSNEYLTRVNLMKAFKFPEFDTPIVRGKKVAVIGGGNTAMDSVRTSLRLGAERAMIIYRRSEKEMPARIEEIHHAKEEGVEFLTLTNPVEYLGDPDGRVTQVKVQKMELGEPDESGRRRPRPIKGSEYLIDVDTVVVGIGTSPNPLIPQALPELETTRWKTIVVNEETMETSIPGMFAGGDIVRGGATVILAMGDGKIAAEHMHKYLQSK
ncbi:MAG: NADPH-dependent glutamate synthase [Candidatus Aminicenantes bacterium]|nr:NADPH-dependent glutamate synthase [Candidatus Aminicenantes bacterium]NIM84421.1 NADPH-dependent glutamate synthase [Candidatus Aminicenantes bacterium]NIN23900.1 NADPH-dependent glutamate synthase [Candidatus Aminicenantes bacterium]NIN47616.1 NADPH-dependent glutamate synthase [Candidatus Aminicenantes bacterium]NIN90545.1 NADPH-dependent glutamate synthase [Candidatus Aminicenantes bacterium]